MTSEVWLPVKMEGIKENMYFISSKSNIIGSRGRMSPDNGNVNLRRKNGKKKKLGVHVISCTAFYGEKQDPTHTVDHIDRNWKNNDISNLRWASRTTQALNRRRPPRKGFSVLYKSLSGDEQKTYVSAGGAGREFGIKHLWRKLKKGPVKVDDGTLEYVKLFPEKGSIIKDVPEWILNHRVKSKIRVSSCGLVLTNGLWTTGSPCGRPHKYFFAIYTRVHRLMAASFLGKSEDPLETVVNHIDGNGFNNRIENLEWSTESENSIHAVETGLRGDLKPVVRYKLDGTRLDEFSSGSKATKFMEGKTQSAISDACTGRKKTAYKFLWRFLSEAPDRLDPIKG